MLSSLFLNFQNDFSTQFQVFSRLYPYAIPSFTLAHNDTIVPGTVAYNKQTDRLKQKRIIFENRQCDRVNSLRTVVHYKHVWSLFRWSSSKPPDPLMIGLVPCTLTGIETLRRHGWNRLGKRICGLPLPLTQCYTNTYSYIHLCRMRDLLVTTSCCPINP